MLNLSNNKNDAHFRQCIKLYAQGNNDVVGILYKELFGQLVFFAYSFVKVKEIAADLVSGFFEQLLNIKDTNTRKSFDVDETHFINIMHLIVKNKCLDYLKIKNNRQRILAENLNIFKRFSVNEMEQVFNAEALKLLKNELSAQQQKILSLHLEGFDNHEIAQNLSLSYNTVRNTLSVSKKRARQLWKIFFE